MMTTTTLWCLDLLRVCDLELPVACGVFDSLIRCSDSYGSPEPRIPSEKHAQELICSKHKLNSTLLANKTELNVSFHFADTSISNSTVYDSISIIC
jgi:hypothetical protein